MSFFNLQAPIFRRKEITQDVQNSPGILRIHLQIGNITIFSTFYTRLDQACILWGLISAAIFITAQFLPISWIDQAIWWSTLTIIGTICMVNLTWFRVRLEKLHSVLYCWIIMMLTGLAITDLSIFLGWGEVLMRLCPMWLGLVALCYLWTGVEMRSRTFFLTGIIHLLAILILPLVEGWQFLTTGIVMGLSVVLLAEFRWDMRHKIDWDLLTPEQKLYI